MRTIFILLLYNHLFAVVVAVAAVLFCTCNANCWNNPIRTDAKQKKYRSVIAVVGSISIARTKEALDSLRMCAVRSTFLGAFLPLRRRRCRLIYIITVIQQQQQQRQLR